MGESPLGLQPVDGGRAGAPAVQSSLLRSTVLPYRPLTRLHRARVLCSLASPLTSLPSPPHPASPAEGLDSSACRSKRRPRPRRRPPPRDPGGGPASEGRGGEWRAQGGSGARLPAPRPIRVPSAAGSHDSASVCVERWKSRCSSAAAGRPARRSGSTQGVNRGRSWGRG